MAVDQYVSGKIYQNGVAVQPTLVSGTNIKTVNGNSLLGSGNLTIGSGIHCLMPPFSGKSYIPMITYASLTPSAITSNLIRLIPFIPARDITISSTSLNVTSLVAGVNARILVYDDLNGLPNNKVIESTDLSCATTGVKTFTTTYTFLAGNTYWVGNYCSGSFSLQLIPIANLLMINNTTAGVTYTGVTYSSAFGSAPTSLNGVSATYSNGAFPAIMFNI
jgi:hypothetical protein